MMQQIPITVCIVEDRYDIREALRILIHETGDCACVGAYASAEDALEAIPALQPDVVLMDINLPGIDGIECIRQLKPLCPKVQFMICTVYDEEEKIFDALSAGANSFILKRSSGEKLVEAVKELYNGGSPISGDIARKIVKHFQRPATSQQDAYALTAREKEILELLARGITYQQVADQLFISSKTVRKHVYNIYEKLQVNSRMEAVNKYFGRQGG
jgi:two-component system, NarL family, response regulator LiaR